MVNTRHTRPHDGSQPWNSTRLKKGTARALRKLFIDGNDGLRGEREQTKEPPKQVYHWRGAVYAIDENTPEEWIEAQPKRYLKRKREDDGSNSEESEQEESEEESEEEQYRGRRSSSHPAQKKGRAASTTRAKSARRTSTLKPTPKKRKLIRSSPIRTPAPHLPRPVGRPRGRPPKQRSIPIPAKRAIYKPRQPTGRPASSQQDSEHDSRDTPIPWADMMTGRIAVSMTRFLAVQKQLRKLHYEYGLARDLHKRVLAHEATRGKTDKPRDKDVEVIAIDDMGELVASVQRTDSRLGRTDDADTVAGARDASETTSTPKSAAMASPHATYFPLPTSKSAHQDLSLQRLLDDTDDAAHGIAADRRSHAETPEEKSRRFNTEWDKMVAWPKATLTRMR